MSITFDGFVLRPRRGGVLRVLIIARISTTHQDPRSLADQIALCEKYVRDRYPGAVVFVHVQGQGSGEFLERREVAEAEAATGVGCSTTVRSAHADSAAYSSETIPVSYTRWPVVIGPMSRVGRA